jgi:mannose-6-phosphate isomerase-like protein (cupin superfamily)
MVDIDYENLPAQQGYVIDTNELADDQSHHRAEGETADVVQRLFATNELRIAYVEMGVGQEFARHTHTPDLYQIYFPVEGTLGVSYIDNDGQEQYGEAEPGEVLYLPPGADNKLVNAGDTRLRIFTADQAKPVSRVGQIIEGEADSQYAPDEAEHLLRIDPYRGTVFEKNGDLVREY